MSTVVKWFSFLFTDSHAFQRFAEQPKYTEVNPGQDALLTCKIIDKRGTCSWQKDNKVSAINIYLFLHAFFKYIIDG